MSYSVWCTRREKAHRLFVLFAVKPNNDAVLFVLVAIIGATGLTLLPVVLELGVELTRNADGSSAFLWFRYAPLIQLTLSWASGQLNATYVF